MCLGCPWDPEELKRRVAAAHPSFYLISSRTPGATWKVLWYRANPGRSCKVDLLLPGVMDIPSVPIGDIEYPEQGKPCAPFALVFLSKIHAWVQHRDAEEMRFRAKARTDARDLIKMLPIAITKGLSIQNKEAHLSPLLVASATSGVPKFVEERPETLDGWRAFGFSV